MSSKSIYAIAAAAFTLAVAVLPANAFNPQPDPPKAVVSCCNRINPATTNVVKVTPPPKAAVSCCNVNPAIKLKFK